MINTQGILSDDYHVLPAQQDVQASVAGPATLVGQTLINPKEKSESHVTGDVAVMDHLSSHKRDQCARESGRVGGRDTPDPAAIETRLQSNRKGLCQTQSNATKGRRTILEWPLDPDRQPHRYLPASRMYQLIKFMRIRSRMIEKQPNSPLLFIVSAAVVIVKNYCHIS